VTNLEGCLNENCFEESTPRRRANHTTWIAGKEKNKQSRKPTTQGRGPVGKEAAFSIIEREGWVRTFHLPEVTAKTLKPILKAQIDEWSYLMTDDGREFRKLGFKDRAGGYSPEKIPMPRLAEYMEQLSHIMGEAAQVHFKRIASGSAMIVSRIEHEAVPKVRARISHVKNDEGPSEAQRAYDTVNKFLREDHARSNLG
jgi:hypothetical protein